MKRFMHRRGFEPLTVRSEAGSSIQLSYRCVKSLKIASNYSKVLDFLTGLSNFKLVNSTTSERKITKILEKE